MGKSLLRAAVLFEASFFWYEHIFSPVGAFQHVTGMFRAFAPLILPLVHRPGCLWRAVRGVQLAGGHNAFEAGLVLFPGALAALVFAPDRGIPRDGGDGLSHRVLPTIGRVYGLPRRARVLGAPCAWLPRRHCEDSSQRKGCELVKRPPFGQAPAHLPANQGALWRYPSELAYDVAVYSRRIAPGIYDDTANSTESGGFLSVCVARCSSSSPQNARGTSWAFVLYRGSFPSARALVLGYHK